MVFGAAWRNDCAGYSPRRVIIGLTRDARLAGNEA